MVMLIKIRYLNRLLIGFVKTCTIYFQYTYMVDTNNMWFLKNTKLMLHMPAATNFCGTCKWLYMWYTCLSTTWHIKLHFSIRVLFIFATICTNFYIQIKGYIIKEYFEFNIYSIKCLKISSDIFLTINSPVNLKSISP